VCHIVAQQLDCSGDTDEKLVTPLMDKMAQLTPERRGRIEAEADWLHAEYQALKDLRKARALTQAQLAESLGIRQATIAQLAKCSDLILSILRSDVEAMGGAWGSGRIPNQTPVSLGDTDKPCPRHQAPARRKNVPEQN
jgi:hypothetical protein